MQNVINNDWDGARAEIKTNMQIQDQRCVQISKRENILNSFLD